PRSLQVLSIYPNLTTLTSPCSSSYFFYQSTPTTNPYTLSLHDALPISATSRQNTKDQVYAQNEMLAYQQKESTARVASIMENTNLSKQQQVSEIMRQMLTQAQTAGQYFTNDQIKEMTRKVSA